MLFLDSEHEAKYKEFLGRMRQHDCYHRSMAYLLSMDRVLRYHEDDVFDFSKSQIRPESLQKGFQTGSSRRTTRLAFNLWNGTCSDGETYTDKFGHEQTLPSEVYAPDEIFCYANEYLEYYFEAIRIRVFY